MPIPRTEKAVSDFLFRRLEKYGAIKWHKNKNHSFYLKFKDVRLGSIRIANHTGRSKYKYTYELFIDDKNILDQIADTLFCVVEKSKTIHGFNPDIYVIYAKSQNRYLAVKDYKEYKEYIYHKKN